MKHIYIRLIVPVLFSYYLITAGTFCYASDTIIIEDNFADRTKFLDNSLLTLWGANITPTTTFNLEYKSDSAGIGFDCLSLINPGSAYYSYSNSNGLKTLSSIEYEVGRIKRGNCTIIVEFDVLWSDYSNWGEGGRLVVTLVDGLPNGGAKFKQVDSVGLVHPFGRPTYNMRIRNTKYYATSYTDYIQTSTTFMLYGGGLDPDGEFEKYNGTWWLPGFSSEPGGTSPGQPGNLDYPVDETKKSTYPFQMVASRRDWKHVTWVIMPEKLELYHRLSSEPESANQLVSFMAIPKDSFGLSYMTNMMNTVHGTSVTSLPTFYKWFPTFNAVKFYFAGGRQNYLANVKVTKKELNMPSAIGTINFVPVVVFPNPTYDGKITVAGSEFKKYKVEVIDLTGKICFQNTSDGISKEYNLDLSFLPKGLYLLIVSDGVKQYRQKILIQ